MKTIFLALLSAALCACATFTTFPQEVEMVVSTQERDARCRRVCCYDKGQIVLREYPTLSAGSYELKIPAGLHVPTMLPENHGDIWRVREFGRVLSEYNGLSAEWNALYCIGHEAGHAQGLDHGGHLP